MTEDKEQKTLWGIPIVEMDVPMPPGVGGYLGRMPTVVELQSSGLSLKEWVAEHFQIIGDTFVATPTKITSIEPWKPIEINIPPRPAPTLDEVKIPEVVEPIKEAQRGISKISKALPDLFRLEELIKQQQQSPFQQELERTNTKIEFSKYPDGSLRLYPPGSIVGDTPAGYSQENVVVKIRVYKNNVRDGYIVIIPTTRHALDLPGAEEKMAIIAYNWRE